MARMTRKMDEHDFEHDDDAVCAAIDRELYLYHLDLEPMRTAQGYRVAAYDEASRSALVYKGDGESFPYIACYGYDKESGTWSQGYYSENLTDAKEEYARLTGSDLVAVKAGQSFAVVHGAELAGIGLEDTHQRVSLGGRTRELFRGKTYEDSRKIDTVLDSHDELSIADHLVGGPLPKKDAPEAGGRELSEKARADAREAMGLAACEADRTSVEEALATGDEAQAPAAGTGEAPRQDPAPGGDAR